MKHVKNILAKRGVPSLIGVVAFCLLVVFAGPHLSVGAYQPFLPWTVRVFLVVIVLLIWGVVQLLLALRAQGRDAKLVSDLVADASRADGDARDQDEVVELARGFERALDLLKARSSSRQLGQRFLYEIPWYAIIGPPGCGKTTALVKSGMPFPIEAHARGNSLQGTGGTRNCDWWFTDQAVILDTAGRYATHETDPKGDQLAWLGFLDLLKRNRPRRPINGVIVALSVDEFLEPDASARAERLTQHGRALRERLTELDERLGLRLPIYLVFTKCDRLSGFVEYFEDFDPRDREQVWGMTFPSVQDGLDLREFFDREFAALVARIERRRVHRMKAEPDLDRCSRIFRFPDQLAALSREIGDFVTALFDAARYRSPPYPRGVYFTSGTQEGTPIDRLLLQLADSASLGAQTRSELRGSGRSYFLKDLFLDVIFREAELAGTSPKVESRIRRVRFAVMGACVVTCVVALCSWFVGYQKQSALALAAKPEVDRAVERVGALGAGGSEEFGVLRSVLSPLETVVGRYQEQPVPGWSRVRLNQGADVEVAAAHARHRLLAAHLTSLLAETAERRIERLYNADSGVGDGVDGEAQRIAQLRDALRAYLLLGSEKRLGDLSERDRKFLLEWFAREWRESGLVAEEADRRVLEIQEGLAAGLRPTRLNVRLVTSLRRRVSREPLATQVLSSVRQVVDRFPGEQDVVLSRVLGGPLGSGLDSGSGRDPRVPGFFTAARFAQVLEPMAVVAKEVAQDSWVLSTGDAERPVAEPARLVADAVDRYEEQYVTRWREFLDDTVVSRFDDVESALATAHALRRVLPKVVDIVVENTQLFGAGRGPGAVGDILGKAGATGGVGSDALAALEQRLPGARVAEEFRQIHALVGSPGVDRAVEALAGLIRSLEPLSELATLRDAPEATAAFRSAEQLEDAAAQLPQPMRDWMETVAFDLRAMLEGRALRERGDQWSRVHGQCERALGGRYPLRRGAREEVGLTDFGAYFGAGGYLDQFLSTLGLDALERVDGQTLVPARKAGIGEDAFQHLALASKIRRSFFAPGSNTPVARFSVQLRAFPDDADAVSVRLDGVEVDFRAQDKMTARFAWPGSGGEQGVRINVARKHGDVVSQSWPGAWGVWRWLEASAVDSRGSTQFVVRSSVEGIPLTLLLVAESADNPFTLRRELSRFMCRKQL